MKNRFLFLAASFATIVLLSSCSSTRELQGAEEMSIAKIDRSEYVLLDRVESKASSTRVWFLFIPFGGKSPDVLKEKAYHRALESTPYADGIIDPAYNYKKFSIPLILLNFNFRTVEMTGRPYRLKSEDELTRNKK